VVQKDVLDRIADDSLRVYLVWVPILESDTLEAARRAAAKVRDRRVHQYWDDGLRLGRALGDALALPKDGARDGAAWDVYLVYRPGERFAGSKPPLPDDWMHQLDRVSKAPFLDGTGLRERVLRAMHAM
jgi:hypothetical protein